MIALGNNHRSDAMQSLMIRLVGLALTLIVGVSDALADSRTAKLEGVFKDWSVYTRQSSEGLVCFAVTPPQDSAPNYARHGEVYFIVASWKSKAATEQPNFLAGYALSSTSIPKIRLGASRFPMYSNVNEAFIEDNQDERRLIRSMRAGSAMRVEALSDRGTATSYEFSLLGVTKALAKAEALCA